MCVTADVEPVAGGRIEYLRPRKIGILEVCS
jgi:hypothetical protein